MAIQENSAFGKLLRTRWESTGLLNARKLRVLSISTTLYACGRPLQFRLTYIYCRREQLCSTKGGGSHHLPLNTHSGPKTIALLSSASEISRWKQPPITLAHCIAHHCGVRLTPDFQTHAAIESSKSMCVAALHQLQWVHYLSRIRRIPITALNSSSNFFFQYQAPANPYHNIGLVFGRFSTVLAYSYHSAEPSASSLPPLYRFFSFVSSDIKTVVSHQCLLDRFLDFPVLKRHFSTPKDAAHYLR